MTAKNTTPKAPKAPKAGAKVPAKLHPVMDAEYVNRTIAGNLNPDERRALEDILVKDKSALTENDKGVLKARVAYLTGDERNNYVDILTEEVEDVEEEDEEGDEDEE